MISQSGSRHTRRSTALPAAQQVSGRRLSDSNEGAFRATSYLRLIPNVLQDQKRIWTFPWNLVQGKHWKPTAAFLAALVLLFTVDPYDPSFFRHTRAFHTFNLVASGHNATVLMWTVMLGALGLGLILRRRYLQHTFLYAFQAVLDCEILTQVLKGLDRRIRPQDIHHYDQFLGSWFRDKGAWYAGPGSFPSGHMIAAMCIATVFAIRYRRYRWAPWMAYGVAAVIGCSRITLLSHFPSDVFAGTVFGYVIARYVVLEPATAKRGPVEEKPPAAEEIVAVS